MSQPSPQHSGPRGSPLLDKLPESLLLKVLTNATSFFCLQNLRPTCRRIRGLLASEEHRAARASEGIVDRALVVVSRDFCNDVVQYHVLVDGHWRRSPWNLESQREEQQATVITRSASGEHVMFTGNSSDCSSSLISANTGHRHSLPPHQTTRHGPAACHWGDRTILAGGLVLGEDLDDPLRSVEVFDPASMAWNSLPDMPHASFWATAGMIGSKLYVAGGKTYEEQRVTCLICLQIYDTTLNAWELGPDMPEHLHNASAAVVRGKLYIAGRSKTTKSYVCVYFTPESMEWKYTAPVGPVSDGLGGSRVHVVNHNKSLWVLYTNITDSENYWRQLQNDGEWSEVFLASVPELPSHLVRSVRAVVSILFKP